MAGSSEARGWRLGWLAIFCLNLILPLPFGWDVTRGGGRAGMFIATVALWLWADHAVRRDRFPRFALLVGGGIVALSQFFAIPQILAGLAAMNIVASLGLASGAMSITNELGGFTATALTGAFLQAV